MPLSAILKRLSGENFYPLNEQSPADPNPIPEFQFKNLLQPILGVGAIGLIGWALFRFARSPQLVRGVDWPGFPHRRFHVATMRPPTHHHHRRIHPTKRFERPAPPQIHDSDDARRLRREIEGLLIEIPRNRGRRLEELHSALEKRLRAHSNLIGLRTLTADRSYPPAFRAWHYRLNRRLFHADDAACRREMGRLGRRYNEDDYLPEITLPLKRVVPFHPLTAGIRGRGASDERSYLNNLNEIRAMIVCRLLNSGWKVGSCPSAQMLRGVITSLGWEEQLPCVFGPTTNGLYILSNGHHRISALITLVTDGILPLRILNELPVVCSTLLDSKKLATLVRGSFREDIFPFSWHQVLAFDSRLFSTLHRLGVTATLRDVAQV
ncbi:MAG: hypothetical protein HYT76_09665 [Deltaproteobacteria bacterium]|nr:hypothetical protein [Deltaproteobacteria bacterium]